MKDMNTLLQAATIAILMFGIYTLDQAGDEREAQLLVWLDDAEKERAEQTKRIRSMEVFLMKRTDYVQTE